MDRGRTLIRSEEEWRGRFEAMVDRRTRYAYYYLGAVGAAMVLTIFFLASTLEESAGINARVFLVMVTVILLGTFGYLPAMMHIIKRGLRKMPAPGLYEAGLQITPYLLIPYHEIAGTERLPARILREEGIRLRLASKPPLPLRLSLPYPLAVAVEFLGEDGAMEMESRVHGRLREPPRLVLYGP